MNRPKIKFRNFWLSIGDQVFRKKAFYNIFISHNAWGILSINFEKNTLYKCERYLYNCVQKRKR